MNLVNSTLLQKWRHIWPAPHQFGNCDVTTSDKLDWCHDNVSSPWQLVAMVIRSWYMATGQDSNRNWRPETIKVLSWLGDKAKLANTPGVNSITWNICRLHNCTLMRRRLTYIRNSCHDKFNHRAALLFASYLDDSQLIKPHDSQLSSSQLILNSWFETFWTGVNSQLI